MKGGRPQKNSSGGKGSRLRAVTNGLARVSAVVSAVGLLFLMAAVVAEVVSRQLRGRSIPGLIEFSEVVLVVSVFFGLAYCQYRKDHVSTEVVGSRLAPRVRHVMRSVALIVTLLIVGWLAYETAGRALESVRVQESRFGLLRVPVWPARLAIPIGAIGFALVAMVDVADEVRSIGKSASEPEVDEARKGLQDGTDGRTAI